MEPILFLQTLTHIDSTQLKYNVQQYDYFQIATHVCNLSCNYLYNLQQLQYSPNCNLPSFSLLKHINFPCGPLHLRNLGAMLSRS